MPGSIQDERIKAIAENVLDSIRKKLEALRPKYEEARDQGGEFQPMVQALIDAVLRYDGSQGPHGAIWHLSKAHSIALELVGPRTVVDEYEALMKREADLLAQIKAHDQGDAKAAEKLQILFDDTGRPLQ